MVDVPEYFCRHLNSQHNSMFLHSFELGSIKIDLPTHKSKLCCLLGQKNQSEPAKTQFRPGHPKTEKTTVSVFFGPGLVFFQFQKMSGLVSVSVLFFWAKRPDWTKLSSTIDEIEFWHHLKTVIDKLEPICLGTNMNQCESMHLDKVLLKFSRIFLHFQKHSKLGG